MMMTQTVTAENIQVEVCRIRTLDTEQTTRKAAPAAGGAKTHRGGTHRVDVSLDDRLTESL